MCSWAARVPFNFDLANFFCQTRQRMLGMPGPRRARAQMALAAVAMTLALCAVPARAFVARTLLSTRLPLSQLGPAVRQLHPPAALGVRRGRQGAQLAMCGGMHGLLNTAALIGASLPDTPLTTNLGVRRAASPCGRGQSSKSAWRARAAGRGAGGGGPLPAPARVRARALPAPRAACANTLALTHTPSLCANSPTL